MGLSHQQWQKGSKPPNELTFIFIISAKQKLLSNGSRWRLPTNIKTPRF